MTALEQNAVSRAMDVAKTVVDEVKPILDQLNIVYDAAGGVKTTLTQSDLDSVPSYSGLTKQQCDDGLYALTSTIKAAIDNSYTQLMQLAARA